MDFEFYMRRALQLARNGEGHVSPNPMVGAVIVADNRIIGEGYHIAYGGPHAEVNAVNSIKPEDLPLLKKSTVFVTLEPCAHYGKTPPCARLLVDRQVERVVIASLDPNPLVAGKGVEILGEAGIKVETGVLKDEADFLNRRFFTYMLKKRPYVLLKWAQSADGFMAAFDRTGKPVPVKFSNPLSTVFMHRERSHYMSIMVGKNTRNIDNPRLNVRYWGGKDPVVIDCDSDMDLQELMNDLYSRKILSLMVEGGQNLLKSFIKMELFDEVRVETSSLILGTGLSSPVLPRNLTLISMDNYRNNYVATYIRRHLKRV